MSRAAARQAFAVRNDLAEIERLAPELEAFGTRHSLPADTIFAVNLALEEVISNIISHGYDDHGPHVIDVELQLQGRAVLTMVEDDGRPFDPLAAALPDVEVPLEEREVGGLGVLLVRKLMDDVRYERVGERNVLTFSKRFDPGPQSAND